MPDTMPNLSRVEGSVYTDTGGRKDFKIVLVDGDGDGMMAPCPASAQSIPHGDSILINDKMYCPSSPKVAGVFDKIGIQVTWGMPLSVVKERIQAAFQQQVDIAVLRGLNVTTPHSAKHAVSLTDQLQAMQDMRQQMALIAPSLRTAAVMTLAVFLTHDTLELRDAAAQALMGSVYQDNAAIAGALGLGCVDLPGCFTEAGCGSRIGVAVTVAKMECEVQKAALYGKLLKQYEVIIQKLQEPKVRVIIKEKVVPMPEWKKSGRGADPLG